MIIAELLISGVVALLLTFFSFRTFFHIFCQCLLDFLPESRPICSRPSSRTFAIITAWRLSILAS